MLERPPKRVRRRTKIGDRVKFEGGQLYRG